MTHDPDPAAQTKGMAEKITEEAAAEVEAQARAAAEQARTAGLGEADDAAEALDRAATAFDPGSLQASALNQLAETVDGLAGSLRDKPLDAIIDDVADFARKNPAQFLGGAELPGFAAPPFLKAPSPDAAPQDPWSGHLAPAGEVPS